MIATRAATEVEEQRQEGAHARLEVKHLMKESCAEAADARTKGKLRVRILRKQHPAARAQRAAVQHLGLRVYVFMHYISNFQTVWHVHWHFKCLHLVIKTI
jgi:hypothetical protein